LHLLVSIIQGLAGRGFGEGKGERKAKNNVCFCFAFDVVWCPQVFNRGAMNHSRLAVAGCIEHERLAFELLEVRTRGQYLTRLREVNSRERAELDRRERAALAQLVDHEMEHGCAR
jgi:hypothetical protein